MDEIDTEMDNGMTKKVVNRTLYLIYLLTGEEYMLVKKTYNEDLVKQGNPHGSGSIERPGKSYSFHLPVQNNTEKIMELNNQVTQLLTGKGPKCREDSAVTFSPDEWEFLEGHKDFTTAVLKNKDRHSLPDLPRETAEQHLAAVKSRVLQNFFDASSQIPVAGGKKNKSAPSTMSLSLPDLSTEQNARNMEFQKSPEKSLDPNFQIAHDPPNSEPFSCPVCGKCFPFKQNLRVHKRMHSFPFAQPRHGNARQFQSSLPKKEPRVFKCPKCDWAFSSAPNLLLHYNIHLRKDFACLECGEAFNSLQLLDLHQTNTTRGEMYPCGTCGKSFIYSKCLLHHQESHKEEVRIPKPKTSKSKPPKHTQKTRGRNAQREPAATGDGDDDAPTPSTE